MDTFSLWLQRYADAWTHRDPDAVLELFAPGARFHETPFAEPLEGPEAIREHWARGSRYSRGDVRFQATPIAVSGAGRGVAHWQAEFTSEPAEHSVMLDGVLTADLDASGRCTQLREWWHRLESHD